MKSSIRHLAVLLVFLLAVMPSTVFADLVKAGQVIASSGQVTARTADGDERRLKRQDPIHKGDTILVGKNGFLQIRFTDGGLFSLRPDTELRIDDYHFEGKQDGNEKAVFNLVKGGLRAISGQIGKVHKENYQLHTPVATIGIRGTDYEVVLTCKGTCSLGGYVFEGSIYATGDGGTIVLEQNEAVYYPGDGSPPRKLTEEEYKETFGDPPPEGGPEVLEDPLPSPSPDPGPPDLPPPEVPNNFGYGNPAPTGAAAAFAATWDEGGPKDGVGEVMRQGANGGNDEVYIDTVNGVGNVVTRLVHAEPGSSDCDPNCELNRGTATLVNTGGNASVGVNWGAWNGNWSGVINGGAVTPMGRFHYIYSPNVTQNGQFPAIMSDVTFSHIGGTTPTDAQGNTGTYIQTPSMVVSFYTYEIKSYDVAVKFDHGTWNRTYTGQMSGGPVNIDAAVNTTSFPLSVSVIDSDFAQSCYPNCNGTGQASATFLKDGATHAISSYAMPAVTAGVAPVVVDGAVGTSLMAR